MTKTKNIKEKLKNTNDILKKAEETEKGIDSYINQIREQTREENKELDEFFATNPTKEETFPTIDLPSGEKMSAICVISQKEKEITNEDIQEGEKKLESIIKKRKQYHDDLDILLKENQSLMTKMFDLINATDEQIQEYLELIQNDIEITEDIYFDIFGTTISGEDRFTGLSKDIIAQMIDKSNYTEEQKLNAKKILLDESISEDQLEEALRKELQAKQDEKIFNCEIKPLKKIDFSKVDSKELVEILDKQAELNERAIKGFKNTSELQKEIFDLNTEFTIFELKNNKVINITEDEKYEKQGQFFVKICDELIRVSEVFQAFQFLVKKKNPSNYFAESYLDEKEEETKALQKLKKDILKQEEKKQNEIEKFPDFKPIPTEKAIAFTNKLAKNLYNLENGIYTDITKQGGKSKKLSNLVERVLIENAKITTEKPLEPFDKVVLNTIYSVIQNNSAFDIQMLKVQMTQKQQRHKSEIDADIEKSIDKLRTTLIQIEIPEDLKETLNIPFDKVGIKENILNLKEYYVIKGGHKKSVYSFISNSIYFDYGIAKKQLQTKDNLMLEGGLSTSSKENCILTDELSTRVQDMIYQKSKKKSYIEEIVTENLLDLVLTEKDKTLSKKILDQKKKRFIETIETILKDYKEKKFIKNFTKYSKGYKIKL